MILLNATAVNASVRFCLRFAFPQVEIYKGEEKDTQHHWDGACVVGVGRRDEALVLRVCEWTNGDLWEGRNHVRANEIKRHWKGGETNLCGTKYGGITNSMVIHNQFENPVNVGQLHLHLVAVVWTPNQVCDKKTHLWTWGFDVWMGQFGQVPAECPQLCSLAKHRSRLFPQYRFCR